MRATTTPTYTPVPMVMERAARNRARLEAMLANGKSPLFTALVVWNGEKYKAVRFILASPQEEERPIFQRGRNYRGCRAFLRIKKKRERRSVSSGRSFRVHGRAKISLGGRAAVQSAASAVAVPDEDVQQ